VTSTAGPADAHAAAPEQLTLLDRIDTPSLVVDLDVLLANLREMSTICRDAGVELFPHAKTHRTVEYGRLQLENGAAGLTVATVGEAESFADSGATHIVIAYPLVGELKLTRVRALAERAQLTLAADGVEGARAIGRCFAAAGLTADLCIEINTGMNRSGVAPAEAVPLAHEIRRIEGVRLRGVFTHEGSVYSAENDADLVGQSRTVATAMTKTAADLRAAGHQIDLVSLGASASARIVAGEPGVTQVRPGIYAFNDMGQIALGNASPATCAVRVVATVVSHPTPDRAFIDAGSKSLSQDRLPPRGSAIYPGFGHLADLPSWNLHRLSEEHGWLKWTGNGAPKQLTIGQQVQVIPNHVCTVFSSLGESIALREGHVVGHWSTLRRG
jgi:D-serine deaminase-like pyridoxal phosphate-dependent protein